MDTGLLRGHPALHHGINVVAAVLSAFRSSIGLTAGNLPFFFDCSFKPAFADSSSRRCWLRPEIEGATGADGLDFTKDDEKMVKEGSLLLLDSTAMRSVGVLLNERVFVLPWPAVEGEAHFQGRSCFVSSREG